MLQFFKLRVERGKKNNMKEEIILALLQTKGAGVTT